MTIKEMTVFPENRSVDLQWFTPIDPDTDEPADVVEYKVQWGPMMKGIVEEFIRKEGEQTITVVGFKEPIVCMCCN